jgi:T5orf172 domain
MKGYVYILTNPAFTANTIKVGKTSRTVEERIKELDTTGVPLPYEIYASFHTSKFNELEKHAHKVLSKYLNKRIRDNREFFNIDPKEAFGLISEAIPLLPDCEVKLYAETETKREDNNKLSKEDIKELTRKPYEQIDRSKDIVISKDKKKKKKKEKQRPPFKFSMVGIKPGDHVLFVYGSLDVEVTGENTVKYKGIEYSLSGFTKEFIPKDKANNSGAYQGPKYFVYKNELLTDLRDKKENI